MKLSPEWAEGRAAGAGKRQGHPEVPLLVCYCRYRGYLLLSAVFVAAGIKMTVSISRACDRSVAAAMAAFYQPCLRPQCCRRNSCFLSAVFVTAGIKMTVSISRACDRSVAAAIELSISRACGLRGGTTLPSPRSGPCRTTGRRWSPAPGPGSPARRRAPSGCRACRGRR